VTSNGGAQKGRREKDKKVTNVLASMVGKGRSDFHFYQPHGGGPEYFKEDTTHLYHWEIKTGGEIFYEASCT